jgi:hypothetical protein
MHWIRCARARKREITGMSKVAKIPMTTMTTQISRMENPKKLRLDR